MITTICSFLISAIIFFVLSFFIGGVWRYYVPASLIILSCWMILIVSNFKSIAQNIIRSNPELFDVEEQKMLLSSASIFIPQIEFLTMFAKMDISAAAGHISIISFIYGIISIFIQNWVGLVICVCVFAFWLKRGLLYTGNMEQDVFRFIVSYSKVKGVNPKKLTEIEALQLANNYNTIIDKLNTLKSIR